ncbi:MAG: TIGR00159 family protein [Selenomonadales bacterium]|jgi:TIGR00159 family protein|nr:diadenylate cyclase CdaA [Clostridiales bacterium]PWL99485.1 MAG: TIGR00159 family protein [Selenomonadales bacterium]
MKEFFINLYNDLAAVFTASIGLLDILDIIIVTIIIYLILRITKETRARQVLKGLGIVIIIAVITSWLRLSVISWLLSMLLQWGVLIAVILFQPELRRVLEQLGRGTFFDPKAEKHKEDNALCIDEMIRAIQSLSKRKVGALIVISQNSDLTDVIRTGTTVDAVISAMLLENIFEPNTPLHDGAMIVKDNRVVAAGCFLPLSDNILIDRKLGTRHRAALGMSERSDAIIIVVSEETGVISYAKEGNLHRYLDSRALRELLEQIYAQPQKPVSRLRDNILRHLKQGKEGEKNER